MADYRSTLVTERTFRVKNLEAFRQDISPWAQEVGGGSPWPEGLIYCVESDGTIWLGGYNASLNFSGKDGEDILIEEIIQRHLAPSEVAVLMEAGAEKLWEVSGFVLVISPDHIESGCLADLAYDLVKKIQSQP